MTKVAVRCERCRHSHRLPLRAVELVKCVFCNGRYTLDSEKRTSPKVRGCRVSATGDGAAWSDGATGMDSPAPALRR